MALAVALVALIAAGIVLVNGGKREPAAPLRAPEHVISGPTSHETVLGAPPEDAHAAEPADPRHVAQVPADRFEGQGRVRGEVRAGPGVVFPQAWTLVIEPHPWLVGSERAVSKRIENAHGERTFDSGEVPLAGYRVRAEAEGLNSTDATVLLVKGSAEVFVTLELLPAGTIDGRVLAADGSPADGLGVVLEARSTQVRRDTTVGANGFFVFGDVIDGEYQLYFGTPEAALFPPADIVFHAPTLRIGDHTLPPTGAIAVTAVDERGRPLAGVAISGSATPRGAVRITTDDTGRALARWLLPGTWRLEGRTADGRRGQLTVQVAAGGPVAVSMSLTPG